MDIDKDTYNRLVAGVATLGMEQYDIGVQDGLIAFSESIKALQVRNPQSTGISFPDLVQLIDAVIDSAAQRKTEKDNA